MLGRARELHDYLPCCPPSPAVSCIYPLGGRHGLRPPSVPLSMRAGHPPLRFQTLGSRYRGSQARPFRLKAFIRPIPRSQPATLVRRDKVADVDSPVGSAGMLLLHRHGGILQLAYQLGQAALQVRLSLNQAVSPACLVILQRKGRIRAIFATCLTGRPAQSSMRARLLAVTLMHGWCQWTNCPNLAAAILFPVLFLP